MLLHSTPAAIACVTGGKAHPAIHGTVKFYPRAEGTLIVAEIRGLPNTQTNFFAFHIHEGSSCGGDFSLTGGHYNPRGALHPNHAGDLPPLLACNGKAFLSVETGRFFVRDVIGKTVVIHSDPDDFHSQPAGNSGSKIACGVICRMG